MSDPVLIRVITTAPGTFSSREGIAEVGTIKEIPVEAYSSVWMQPANKAASDAIKKAVGAEE